MKLPAKTGWSQPRATLCIGLDIAWFGGSASNKSSQFDFIAAALISTETTEVDFKHQRVELINRDPKSDLLCAAIKGLLKSYQGRYERVVFAVDAPLQALTRKHLPNRQPVLTKGSVERRACEEVLSVGRMSIDKASGGANGWHPNIQPGAPLAPRVEAMIAKLSGDFELWTPNLTSNSKLMIECFPAEAIWSAKRQNWFPTQLSSAEAKSYKKQNGKLLTADEVKELVGATLHPFSTACHDFDWKALVALMLKEILDDKQWQKNGLYPGGKMLDDVIDSMLCLNTAISYSIGNAHVWFDEQQPEDGHIIGPGPMQLL